MTVRFYSSVAQQTTLSGSINASTTTIVVASTTGFPASFPYTLAIDYGSSSNELVDVASAAGTTLTVTRAVDGTSGQSHSSGAVVRHVSSGRDFSDSRTHENASTSVHGVTGSVVGTTNTQSLSNKTLTSPTLSGTVATGTSTFSGTPTFSGAVTITGGLTNTTNSALFQRASASSIAVRSSVTGDANDRWQVQADGRHFWGDGTGAVDTTLYRADVDVLGTDDAIRSLRSAAGSTSFTTRVTGDTVSRFTTTAGGTLMWGPGGAGSQDTNLYRSEANVLATDDALAVGGFMTVQGDLSASGNTTITGNLDVQGIGRMMTAIKSADTTRASTTVLADDPHLTFSVVAGATYTIEGSIIYSATAAADINVALTSPASSAGSWVLGGVGLGTGAVTTNGYPLRIDRNTIAGARIYAGLGSSDAVIAQMSGTLRTTNAGTFAIQWAQQVSDAVATTVYQDSWVRLHRIA